MQDAVIALDPLPIVYLYRMSETKVPVEAEKDIADFSGARISRRGPVVAIEAAKVWPLKTGPHNIDTINQAKHTIYF